MALTYQELWQSLKTRLETKRGKDWLIFHKANPHIWTELIKMCREVKALGKSHNAIGTFIGKLRWNDLIDTARGSQGFKINNDFSAIYARAIMVRYFDELNDFFEIRDPATHDDLINEFIADARKDHDNVRPSNTGQSTNIYPFPGQIRPPEASAG